jgi:hypothetical protein
MANSTDIQNKKKAVFETFVNGFTFVDENDDIQYLSEYMSFEDFCEQNEIPVSENEENIFEDDLVYNPNFSFNNQTEIFKEKVLEESTTLDDFVEDLGDNTFKVDGWQYLVLNSSEVDERVEENNKNYVEMMIACLPKENRSFFEQFQCAIEKAYKESVSTSDTGFLASYDGYARDCGEYTAFRTA